MLFPATTVDGKTVAIVKKEYRANEGVFLTDEDGVEYTAVRNGQIIAPVGTEPSNLRPTLPVEDPADPDAGEAQV